MNLNTLRNAANTVTPDLSNPLTIERTVTMHLSRRDSEPLFVEAMNDGFISFHGVGLSNRARPMTRGAVPADRVAESLEFSRTSVTYVRVELR